MAYRAYVYFIRKGSEDIFKIGIATDPKRRLRVLSTGSESQLFLCATIEDKRPALQEDWFHARFASRCINLEWFRVSWDEIKYCLDRWYAPDRVKIYKHNLAESTRHPKYGDASPSGMIGLESRIKELEAETSQLFDLEAAHGARGWEIKRLEAALVLLTNELTWRGIPIPPGIQLPDEQTAALVIECAAEGIPPAQLALQVEMRRQRQ